MKMDVYSTITNRMLDELQKGNIPWHKPWVRPVITSTRTEKYAINPESCAYSQATGKPYSLLNQMMLGQAGAWATFKQISEAGGRVNKGAKSSVIFFWSSIQVKTGKLDDKGVEIIKTVPILKAYNVFHVKSQTTGLEPRRPFGTKTIAEAGNADVRTWEAIEEADRIIRDYVSKEGINYTEAGSDSAYYSPSEDAVVVPSKQQFKDCSEFYSTAFHELTHSTGHKSRLDRFSGAGNMSFGSESYSKEELVAELGAAGMLNLLGIETTASFKNSTAYIQGWSKALMQDAKLFVSASSKAEKALNLILAE